MLNPYTLQPEAEPYRPDSTMAIAIRNEEYRAIAERRERRERMKQAVKNFFSLKK